LSYRENFNLNYLIMMNAIWGGKTNPLEERLEAIEH
jgi:hypothetical protein